MTNDDQGLPRRTFLAVIGAAGAAAGLGGGALPGCGGNGQNTTPFDAGAVTDYAAPVWKIFTANTTVVAHDAGGFFAYSAICTHEDCVMAFCTPTAGRTTRSADGATCCACHRSTFDGVGNVTAGPARTALPHFAVTVASGRVAVDPGTTTAAGTRAVG